MSTKILVAENYNLLRQGIVRLLNNDRDLEVIGEATTGFDAVSKALILRPDVVLMDVEMPGLDGVAATRLLRRDTPTVQVILLSTVETADPDVVAMVQAGARGYITPGLNASNMVRYVKQVVEGRVALSEELTGKLLDGLARGAHLRSTPQDDTEASLTHREKEVLRLISQGTPNKEIATLLFVSENTVRAHVRSLMQKLNVGNRTQLAIYAMRHGIGLDARSPSVAAASAPLPRAQPFELQRIAHVPRLAASSLSPNAA